MLPTLHVNDRILSDRQIYRDAAPQRGDIIIFRPPDRLTKMLQGALKIDQKTVFVKRVIGLPGETIEVKQGRVYVNRRPLAEPYIPDPPTYVWDPVTVPTDSYIVLGDNRNNAFDSHYWGAVPRALVVGKVFWRHWPPERFGPIPPNR
jgi:signal peptidase I